MRTRNFRDLLETRWAKGCFVCVGLDTRLDRIPNHQHMSDGKDGILIEETIFAYNRAIVDATHDIVCAYKPNIAFYEAQGEAGGELFN